MNVVTFVVLIMCVCVCVCVRMHARARVCVFACVRSRARCQDSFHIFKNISGTFMMSKMIFCEKRIVPMVFKML